MVPCRLDDTCSLGVMATADKFTGDYNCEEVVDFDGSRVGRAATALSVTGKLIAVTISSGK